MPIELLEVSETAAIEALAPEWAELWQRCPAATPFQHPAWLLTWWRHLWNGGRACWLALRDCGRLAGLAPLFIWGRETLCVALAGAGITDYLDVLIEPEHESAGTAAVLDWLVRHRAEWHLCDFHDLRRRSPLLSASHAGLHAQVETCAVCPVVRLPGSADESLSGLRGHFRRNLFRARQRVADGGGAIEAARPENFDELLSALFRLHAARWKALGQPGVLAAVEPFHRAAAREFLACGMLRLYALRMPGGLAGVLYGFAGHGVFYAYLDGFDPDFAHLSPGTVLVGHAIECAIAEGLTEFDFLRESEKFKYGWGAVDRPNRRLTLRQAPA